MGDPDRPGVSPRGNNIGPNNTIDTPEIESLCVNVNNLELSKVTGIQQTEPPDTIVNKLKSVVTTDNQEVVSQCKNVDSAEPIDTADIQEIELTCTDVNNFCNHLYDLV